MRTDGFVSYRTAIPDTLNDRLSGFAQLIKVYRVPSEGDMRHSPVASVQVVAVLGRPDRERHLHFDCGAPNFSVRIGVRRFTRLTDAFQQKEKESLGGCRALVRFFIISPRTQNDQNHALNAAGSADQIWPVREVLEAA
jgi:hypothetical protein